MAAELLHGLVSVNVFACPPVRAALPVYVVVFFPSARHLFDELSARSPTSRVRPVDVLCRRAVFPSRRLPFSRRDMFPMDAFVMDSRFPS